MQPRRNSGYTFDPYRLQGIRMRQLLIALFSALAMAASVPAQMLSPDGGATGAQPAVAALTFKDAARPPTMRRTLAESYPAAKRAEVERVFNVVMYEQMAILGMFMLGVQEALKKTPNAPISANMKKAGEAYLRTFLRADPLRVHITNAGLTLDNTDATPPKFATAQSPLPSTGTGPSALSSAALQQANSIETVGFYSKIGFGYGGMMTFNPTPIVLFKSGEALYDMEALKFAGGLAAHKASRPKDWTTWRRAGKAIEVVGSKGWKKITYTKTMDRLPRDFRLAGNYQRTGGGGNLAVGGTSAIIVWSNLSFDRAGHFASGGGSGSSTSQESADIRTSVVTSGRAPNQHGQYSIDGYTLTLKFADGRTERRMIVTDIADPGVIWLDGDGYTSGK
jgi:hypothetical protein